MGPLSNMGVGVAFYFISQNIIIIESSWDWAKEKTTLLNLSPFAIYYVSLLPMIAEIFRSLETPKLLLIGSIISRSAMHTHLETFWMK